MTQVGEGSFSPKKVSSTEEDNSKESEENEVRKKIRICVFFDGTGNNRFNTEAREGNTEDYQDNKPKPGKDDNSYEADKTNVAKLDRYVDTDSLGGYDHLISIYIEGIGTDDGKKDSKTGYALGLGDTGVKEKVNDGINKVLEELRRVIKKNEIIEELVLDVFGFSRGAAAARYFIHRVLKGTGASALSVNGLYPYETRAERISAMPLAGRIRSGGHKIGNKQVRVEFVGLFDTVSSEGFKYEYKHNTQSLKLDSVRDPRVKEVLHLVAADEHRRNFSFSNINSAGDSGTQIFLPGAHSDIGGGYRDDIDEELVLNLSRDLDTLIEDRAKLVEQGWFKEDEIFIEYPAVTERDSNYFEHMKYLEALGYPDYLKPVISEDLFQVNELKSNRIGLDHSYAKIPLDIMATAFCKTGIELTSEFEKLDKVPGQLDRAYDGLKKYVDDKGAGGSEIDDWNDKVDYDKHPWLKDLRNEQLHFSAHYNYSFKVLRPHKPNFYKGLRKRISFHG